MTRFAEIKKAVEKIHTPHPHILLDGDILLPLDGDRTCRLDCYTDAYDRVLSRIKKVKV